MATPLRAAVVGYGFIAEQGHVPGYLQRARSQHDVTVVALADICPARREAAHRALPYARIYHDYASLLAAEANHIDFVDIAAPPYAHAAIAHAAFDSGLHVLCEKPLAASVEEARGLLEHANRVQRVLFPCHNYKHAPVIKSVKGIVEAGLIGSVRQVTLSTFRATHARGTADWDPDWRRSQALSGGGIAMDHGSHTFYLAFDWMGSYPTAITAKMSSVDNFDTEDNFSCTLTFPNGGTATAHLTWTAGIRKVIYTIHGDRGAITVDDDDIHVARMDESRKRWSFEKQSIASDWMDASHVNWFNSLFEDFKRAIDTGDFVGREARDAFHCVQLITTAYASARNACRELPLSHEILCP